MSDLMLYVIVSPLIFVGLIIVFIIIGRAFIVPEQKAVIIERFGRFRRVAGPGLHFMWPSDRKRKFVENGKVVDYVDMRERTMDLPAQVVTTKDNIQIQIESIMYYEITDPAKAVYGIDDVIVAINQFIITLLRNVIANMYLEEVHSEDEEMNKRLREQYARATGDWGITIRSVEFKTITDVTQQSQERYAYRAKEIRNLLLKENKADLKGLAKINQDFISKKFMEEYSYLNLVFDPDTSTLEVNERERLSAFRKAWDNARDAVETNRMKKFREATDELIKLFCDALAFRLLETSASYGQRCGRMLDASNPAFQLNVPLQFPVIYLCKTAFTANDIDDILGLLDRFQIYAEFFALLITFENTGALRQLVNQSAYKHNFIALSHDQFWEILAAKSPIQRLTENILEQVDLVAVSPYTVAGALSNDKIFFGRAEEEKTLLQNISRNDYALLANRKAGKTSLLNRIAPRLQKDPRYQVFYLDLQEIKDYTNFYKKLAIKYPKFEQDIHKLHDVLPLNFSKLVMNIKTRHKNKQILWIFDEVDALLAYDLQFQEELFKTFRSLSQKENVRFIFSGTTTLVERVRHPNSPFLNFCEEIKLGRLDENAARDLVTVPMHAMGVKFENETGIVKRLLGITARHPNLIQYICCELIKTINKKQQRTITEADLHTVIISQECYDHFELVIWGQAKAMEKLIVYLMWSYPEFTKTEIMEQFAKQELAAENVESSLRTLELFAILERKDGAYSFAYREFAKLIEERNEIDVLIERNRREVNRL